MTNPHKYDMTLTEKQEEYYWSPGSQPQAANPSMWQLPFSFTYLTHLPPDILSLTVNSEHGIVLSHMALDIISAWQRSGDKTN